MKSNRLLGSVAAVTLALQIASPATASTEYTTWSFNFNEYTDGPHGSVTDYPGDDLTFSALSGANQLDVTVTGWKVDSPTDNDERTSSIETYSTGLGLDRDESAPWHGVDNKGEDEFLLFDFGEGNEVSLQDFSWGYAREKKSGGGYYAQADATVLKYIGSDPDDVYSDLEDNNTGLTAAGFELVGHYLDVPDAALGDGIQSNEQAHVNSSMYSRFWAIGTYVSNLADTMKSFNADGSRAHRNDVDSKYDAGKLASITVKTRTPRDHPSVPAPASLALLAAGLLTYRGRKQSA